MLLNWHDWLMTWHDHILFCRLQVDQNEHDINVLEGALEKVSFLISNNTDDLFSCVRHSGLWTLSSPWFWPKTLRGFMTRWSACRTRNLAVPGLSHSLTTTWICFVVALSSYPTLAKSQLRTSLPPACVGILTAIHNINIYLCVLVHMRFIFTF